MYDVFLFIGVIIAYLKDLETIPVVRELAKMGNSLFDKLGLNWVIKVNSRGQ